TIDLEVAEARRMQVPGQIGLQVAVARAYAGESLQAIGPELALRGGVRAEHRVRTVEPELFQSLPRVLVRPVMEDGGKIVDFQTVPVDVGFSGQPGVIGIRGLRRHVSPLSPLRGAIPRIGMLGLPSWQHRAEERK